MTEYIRFKSLPPVDGIAFSSARAKGTNVVIFADQDQCLGGKDVSAMLKATGAVELFEYGPPIVMSRGAKGLIL